MADETAKSVEFPNIELNRVDLPSTIEIRESSIIKGQPGAFSTAVIHKDTRYGPYKGEIINAGQKRFIDYRFAWEVFEGDSNILKHTISAMDSTTSNWMRHVNCARFYEEQNILSVQDGYSIFYVAMKDIKPEEELLTWFDPKLLKRTKRRVSKMKRKPVGYTIELVPWADEKKFVPEIIETKRPRKKKILSDDMISLDEDPLAITRMLQRLPKLPNTSKQLKSSAAKTPISYNKNDIFKASLHVSKDALTVQNTKKESKPSKVDVKITRPTESKMTLMYLSNPNKDINLAHQDSTIKKEILESHKSLCAHFEMPSTKAEQGNLYPKTKASNLKSINKNGQTQMFLPNKKIPMKSGISELHQANNASLATVKPVVIKPYDNGSTYVEDHDEMYILRNIDLRPECDDQCPCLDQKKFVKPCISDKQMNSNFVTYFTLLPEHKSLSPDNKIIFKCDVCDSAYNHAFSLKRHYLGVHVNHRYLSKDDIMNCQLETFHTDIHLHNNSPDIKMHSEMESQEPSPVLKQLQSSPVKVLKTDGNKPDISQACIRELSAQSNTECKKTLKHESQFDISGEVTMRPIVEILSSVPSLSSLAQISIDKARSRLSLYNSESQQCTCEEANNMKVTESISLECDESLDSELSSPLESETTCDSPEKQMELESTCISQFVYNKQEQDDVLSGLDEYADCQNVTVHNSADKECNSFPKEQHISKDNAVNSTIEEADIMNPVSQALNSLASDISWQCYSDETPEKSQSDLSCNLSHKNLHCKTSCSLLHIDHCKTTDSNCNLHEEKITESSTDNMYRLQIFPKNELVANTYSNTCCASQINEQSKIVKNQQETISCNKHEQIKNNNSMTTAIKVTIEAAAGLHENRAEDVINSQIVCVSDSTINSFNLTDVVNMDRESNRISVINDQSFQEAKEVISSFPECVKIGQSNDMEEYVTSGNVIAVSNNLPLVSLTEFSDKASSTDIKDSAIVNSLAVVESRDSFSTNYTKSCDENCKQEKSDQQTLQHANLLSISVPKICAESTSNQNQSCQKLIFVTNIVFPVSTPPNNKFQNLSSSQLPVPHLSSQVTHQTSVTEHTDNPPAVLISPGLSPQKDASITQSFTTDLDTFKSLLTTTVAEKAISDLDSCCVSSRTETFDLSCRNTSSESQCTTSETVNITLPSSLSTLPEQISCQPITDTNTESTLPLIAISSQGCGAHLSPCNLESSQNVESSNTFTSPSNTFSQINNQPDDLYRCHMCVLLFKTVTELKLHIKNDPHRFKGGIKQYACQQCSLRFSNKNNLLRHNLVNHSESENYQYRCFTCGKGFTSETYLKMHARFHTGKNFPCKYGCVDAFFPNAASLVKHLRTHHAGLNLKEYLKNVHDEKAQKKGMKHILVLFDGHATIGGVKGNTSETTVASIAPCNLNLPDMGFQVKRGRPKGSKNTHKHDKEIFPQKEDKMIKPVKSEEEPCITDEKNIMQNFKCNKCPIAFMSHIKLLQHRTLMHGADQSVQEYLHQMSKEMDDDGFSDADAVKLVFSPPPSPKTFFENVNRKGVENMSSYIDGTSESLQSCHKHLTCKLSYSEHDPILSLKSEKLEWTMFNFPPCFQYREDCTAFYDNLLKSSQTPLGEITRDRQEKGQSCDSYNVQSDLLVDSMHDSVKLCETDQEIPVAFGTGSLLLSDNRNLKVEENDPSTNSCSRDLSLNKLHLNSQNVLQKRNMDTMTGREDTAGSYKSEIAFNSDMMNCSEHVLASDTKSEGLSFHAEVCYAGNHEHRCVDVCEDFTRDNELLCKSVQNKSTSSVNTMTINTQPPLILGDLVKIRRTDRTNEANTISADCVAHPDATEDSIDTKDQFCTSSISCELYTTKVDQNFKSLSSEKFQALQNRFFEVMDLETLQGSLLDCKKKLHYNLNEEEKSQSDFMCQKSVLLIDALDLQTCGVSLSRKLLLQMITDNRLVLSTGFRQKRELFESSVAALQSKQSHNPVIVASDLCRHEHKRYSIWTGQIDQKFESSSKEDIFCQPLTDALRKFKAMQQKAENEIEKSVRDKEMQGKQHHRTTQKISFAETLGLMTRIDFELSYHVEKEKESTIKAPEVWENYENIWFGKRGNITVVCSICHRHFSCWDLCFRHQLKKHPHLEPASLEMERENYIEDMYYYYPMPYGILAQTQLIPNNLPAPEVYVCTKCAFPFRNLSRLHAHIIVCDPTRQVTTFNHIDNLKKPNYMKKKLIPMMNRHSNQSIKSVDPVKRSTSTTVAVIRDTDKKSCSANGKQHNPKLLTLNNKLSSSLQSRSVFNTPFSFYSGKKQENYKPLYNPQNHARRRELYKVLDQHQCHGCNLKFRSLFMLERHVRSCSGRDKLQNQKPLLSGIISDDAVLRKQHTCRYCTKRFTHIKGVDLHYKRICAVRKVKEEENQLTQEDLAHESELKRIIEHVKWSKSLSKDSSDIIQGNVRVEEDGSLTCLSKKHGCQTSLKKKMKKKGFKWTSLKRHRTDENCCTSPNTSTENITLLMKKENKNVTSLKKKICQKNTKGDTLKRSKNSVANIPSESATPTKARNLAMKQPTRKRDRPKRFDPSEMESSYKKKKKCDQASSSSQTNATRVKYDSSETKGAYYNISLRSSSQKRERADVSPKGRHMLKNKSENSLLKTNSHKDIEAITCREEKIYGKAAQNIESNKLFAKMRKLKEAAKLEMRKSSHFKKVSYSFKDVLQNNSVNYKKTDVGENKNKKCFKPCDNSSSSELLKQLTKNKELLHRQKKLSQGTNLKRKRSDLAEFAGMSPEGQGVSAKKFKKITSSACLTVPISINANSLKMSGSSTLQKTLGKNKINAKSLSAETVASSITLNRESNMIKINTSDKRSSSLKCASSNHKQSSVSVRVVTLSPNGNNLQTCDSSSDIALLPSTFSTKPGQIATNLTHSPESISCSLTQEASQLTKSPSYTKSSTCKNMEVVRVVHFPQEHINVNVDKTSSVSHVCEDRCVTSDEILQGQNSPSDVIYQYENEQLIIGDSNNYELENQFCGHPEEVGVKKLVKNYPPKSSIVWAKNVEDYSQPSSVIGKSDVDSTSQLSPRSSMKETVVHIAENKAVLLSSSGHIPDKTSIPTAKIDQRVSASNGPTGNIVHIISGVPSQSSHIKIMKIDADKSKLNSKQHRFGHVQPVVPSIIASSDVSMAQPVHLSASCMTDSKYTDEKIKNSLSAIIVPSTLASTQISQKKAAISPSTKLTTIPTRLESPVKLVTLRCTVIPTSGQGNKVHTDTRTVQQRNMTQTYTQFNEELNQRPTLSQTNPTIIAQIPSHVNADQLTRHATRDALIFQNTQQTVMQNIVVQSLDQANVRTPFRKPSTHSLLNHNSTSKPILHNPVAAAPQQSLLNSVSFSLANSKGASKSVSLATNNSMSLINSKVANKRMSLINSKVANSTMSLINSKEARNSSVSLITNKVANHSMSLINNQLLSNSVSLVNKVASNSVSLANNKVVSNSMSLINSKDANNPPAEESLLSGYSDMPVTNHIMVTLDDGTTALMDPDSLAQLLTFSPSFYESDSIVSHSNIVAEENITDTVQPALEVYNRDGDVTAKGIGS